MSMQPSPPLLLPFSSPSPSPCLIITTSTMTITATVTDNINEIFVEWRARIRLATATLEQADGLIPVRTVLG